MIDTLSLDDLRSACRVWRIKTNTAVGLSREAGIGDDSLEVLVRGGTLRPDTLERLTEIVYQGHFIYDRVAGEIVKKPRPAPKTLPPRFPRYQKRTVLSEDFPAEMIYPAGPDAPGTLKRKA